MLRKFAVVTDSASDILPSTARELGVSVVPMRINMGGEDLRDGIDVQTGQYLNLLQTSEELPRTSMPSPSDFIETYRSLAIRGYTDILSVHLSRTLSSTVEIPRFLSGSMFNDVNIEVIDSRAASVAEGALVLEAAAVAEAGGTIDEAVAKALTLRDLIKIQFVPRSLTNLVKGGRATALQAVAASALRIRPVVSFNGKGEMRVVQKAHGTRRAANFIATTLSDQEREQGALIYFTLHTRAEKNVERLEAAARERVPGSVCGGRATIGPCIATHVGEGAIGVMSYPASLHSTMLRSEEMFLSL